MYLVSENMIKNILKPQSLIFAPMEGITDPLYRKVILELYPEWDFVVTDFLRLPKSGLYPKKNIFHHYGNHSSTLVGDTKTILQVLTAEDALNTQCSKQIAEMNFNWLDLNLGCPSKTVFSRGGGSYLLSSPDALQKVIRDLRHHYKGFFSVKMRLGVNDSENFISNLKLLEDEGVDLITIHARTRAQLYHGVADWKFFKLATKSVRVPIIANGDIWSQRDIESVFQDSGCYGVMVGRPALKTPWLARLYKEKFSCSKSELLNLRSEELKRYFRFLHKELENNLIPDALILKKMKAIARNIFDDYPEGEILKSQFLRASKLVTIDEILDSLP